MAKKPEKTNYKVVAENRRARYDYAIEDDLEVGIILMGSEVKSLRVGQSNITDSYASCLLYTSPSPRDLSTSRMPSSA